MDLCCVSREREREKKKYIDQKNKKKNEENIDQAAFEEQQTAKSVWNSESIFVVY